MTPDLVAWLIAFGVLVLAIVVGNLVTDWIRYLLAPRPARRAARHWPKAPQ